MKFIKVATLTISTLAMCAGLAFGADYSQYTTEELAQMRTQMRNAAQKDRDAFRQEWQKRMQAMDPSERSQYMNNGAGQGQRMGAGRGSCTGTDRASGSGGAGFGGGRYGRGHHR